jgi:hypothetical protein
MPDDRIDVGIGGDASGYVEAVEQEVAASGRLRENLTRLAAAYASANGSFQQAVAGLNAQAGAFGNAARSAEAYSDVVYDLERKLDVGFTKIGAQILIAQRALESFNKEAQRAQFMPISRPIASARESAGVFGSDLSIQASLDATEREERVRRSILEEQKHQYDAQTAAQARQAVAQKAATDLTIGNVRRYQAEEAKAVQERFKFTEQIASARGGVIPGVSSAATIEGIARGGAGASSELAGVATGIRNIGNASNVATKEAGHFIAILDGLARGNLRQVIASIGSALRDTGLGTAVLLTGVGALAGALGTAAFERMVARFGELALKEKAAAAAAGIGIEDYTRLAGVFQIASGTGANFEKTLEMLAEHAEQAATNPLSKSAGAFATMRIGMQQLTDGMTNPIALLDTLRVRWQEMGASMLRTETFRAILGRGFENIVPYLNLTSSELEKLNASVEKSGNYMTEEFAAKLVIAGEKTRELSGAVEGLEQSFAVLASDSGIIEWLTNIIQMYGEWIRANSDLKLSMPDAEFFAKYGNQGRGLGTAAGDTGVGHDRSWFLQHHNVAPGLVPGGALTGGMGERLEDPYGKLASVDPNLIASVRAATMALPPGQRAEVTSGLRSGANLGGGEHGADASGLGHGIDIRIFDTSGRPIPNQRGIQPGTPAYSAYERMGDAFTGMGGGRWGGNFAYTDIMHFGNAPGFAPGSRASGVTGRGGTLSPADAPLPPAADPFVKYDPTEEKKKFDEAIKHIQDLAKIQDKADQVAVDKAGFHKDQIAKIAVDRAKFDATQVQEEAKVRQNYADKFIANSVNPDSPEAKAVVESALDSTNAKVRALTAEGAMIRANNAAIEEGVRQQINAKEAVLKTTYNERDRLKIQREIAELNAKLTDKGGGAVIMAEEQNRANQQNVTSLEREYAAQEKLGNIRERTLKLQLDAGVDTKKITPQQAGAAEAQEVYKQASALQNILDARMKLATQLNDDVEKDKIKDATLENQVTTLEKIAEINKKIADEAKKVADAWKEPFQSAFDSIGSALDKTVTDLLLHKGTSHDIFKSFYQSAVSSAVNLGSSLLSKAGGALLGNQEGKGFDKVLGDKVLGFAGNLLPSGLSSLFGGGTGAGGGSNTGAGSGLLSAAGNLGSKALGATVTQTPEVALLTTANTLLGSISASTAITAGNTAAEVTATAAGAATGATGSILGGVISAIGSVVLAPLTGGLSLAAGAGSALSGLIGTVGGGAASDFAAPSGIAGFFGNLLNLSPRAEGGIIPAAASGWMVPAAAGGWKLPPRFGTDTVPAALTPGETVLPVGERPSMIAKALQGSMGAGGDTHNYHYSPVFTGPTNAVEHDRWFQNMFKRNAGSMGDAFRNNSVTPRSFGR